MGMHYGDLDLFFGIMQGILINLFSSGRYTLRFSLQKCASCIHLKNIAEDVLTNKVRHSVCHGRTFACAILLTGPHCQERLLQKNVIFSKRRKKASLA